MSRERARRRAEREREAAIRVAARAAEAERRERRAARRRALESWLPRRRGPLGPLAERRRRQVLLTAATLVVLNAVAWVFVTGWAARSLLVAVSLLGAPVLHTLLFRRR